MKLNFLYEITAASRTSDQGSTAPRPLSPVLCPQLNLLNPSPPPPRTKFLGTPLNQHYQVHQNKEDMKDNPSITQGRNQKCVQNFGLIT